MAKNPATPSQFFGTNLMNEIDESKLPGLVSATKAAGVWQVPTQVLMDNLLNDMPTEELAARPEMKYMPPTRSRTGSPRSRPSRRFRRPIVRSSWSCDAA